MGMVCPTRRLSFSQFVLLMSKTSFTIFRITWTFIHSAEFRAQGFQLLRLSVSFYFFPLIQSGEAVPSTSFWRGDDCSNEFISRSDDRSSETVWRSDDRSSDRHFVPLIDHQKRFDGEMIALLTGTFFRWSIIGNSLAGRWSLLWPALFSVDRSSQK